MKPLKFSSKKILLINIFGIGDVLFTTPVIANIKKMFPDVTLGYVCNRRALPVLENNPHLKHLYIYERDEFVAEYEHSKIGYLKKVKNFWSEIKKENYDAVLDFSLNSFMSFFSSWIKIPRRIGFNFKNRSRWLTDTVILEGFQGRHIVEYYLDFCRQLGIVISSNQLEIFLNDKDKEFAQKFIHDHQKNNDRPLVGVVAGGGASWGKDAGQKRWDSRLYAKLADKIVEKFGYDIILFGDKSEIALCENVVEEMKHKPIFAAGKTSVREFAALAQKTKLMIVNDGGPLHISVAAKAQTLSIFGPVDETVYGPYPKINHHVISKNIFCRPCYRKFRKASCEHLSCLSTLSFEEVYEKINNLL